MLRLFLCYLRLLRQAAVCILFLVTGSACLSAEVDADRAQNLVLLDSLGVENLRLETAIADDQTFEQVIFAVGRVEPLPSLRAIISSPAAGRVKEVKVAPGDAVQAGAEVLEVETIDGSAPASPLTLTTPIAGLVTGLHVVRGESFRRIKALMEITDLREVDLVAHIPEHEVALLQIGSTARIIVPAACDKIFRAKLVRLGTQGDRKHGTVEAYFRLPNRDLLMRPGMRAEFRIVAAERKVSALPREAVQGSAAAPFVFVKDYDLQNAFLRVPVVVGQRNDRFVEIVRGLMPGDEVVTTGAYALSSAGRGSVSLKAALDAAHGHAHAEDGTPLSGEEAHNHGSPTVANAARRFTPATLFFATLSLLLTGLLFLSRRHRPGTLS